MADAEVEVNPPETPTDEPITVSPQAPSERQKHPARGLRKRVLGEGEGDFCVYEVATETSDLPTGALTQIPGIPRFPSQAKAMSWVRRESGDLLAGKQVMVFRAVEVLMVSVRTKTEIDIQVKPKININEPPAVDGETEG